MTVLRKIVEIEISTDILWRIIKEKNKTVKQEKVRTTVIKTKIT
jgi:hypothetical protein